MAREPAHQAARAATPLIMGVLNVTPDSFSDGGEHATVDAAVARALVMLGEGADWLDVGGESTRPGAEPVPVAEEVRRVTPVVREILRVRPDAVVSVDTRKPEVARAAVEAGARVVNDVTALAHRDMRALCAEQGVSCVLMHMRGDPATMQRNTRYASLVDEVERFLVDAADRAQQAGVMRDRILIDPGVGFGKSPADNPALIAATPRFAATGYPVLVGASRKRFIGELTGRAAARADPHRRVAGSVGAALAAAHLGAKVLRVHDVAETLDALRVFLPCVQGAE